MLESLESTGHSIASPQSSASSATTIQPEEPSWPLHHAHASDWRARSVSAPASRSSSFSKNLDQLAALNQSAHRFPASIQTSSSSAAVSKQQSASQQSNEQQRNESSRSRSRTSSSASSSNRNGLVTRSTPVSPHLSPSLQFESLPVSSRDGVAARSPATRARSALFSPGAGFTPAHSSALDAGRVSTERASTARANLTTGRSRSTSASGMLSLSSNDNLRANGEEPVLTAPHVADSSVGPSPRPQRARAHSARTSPVLFTTYSSASMYPGEVAASYDNESEDVRPQRTHSVPHLAHVSPIIYGYPYHCDPSSGAPVTSGSAELGVAGYFALPPSVTLAHSRDVSPREVDELPPPYTPDDVPQSISRPQSTSGIRTRSYQQQRSSSRRSSVLAQDEQDEDFGGLSFQAGRSRVRQTSACHASNTNVVQTHGEANRRSETEIESETARPADQSLTSPLARVRTLEGPTIAQEEFNYLERLEHPSKLRKFVLSYLAQPLRLLAVVPGVIGTFWLLRNAVIIAYTQKTIIKFNDDRPSALEFALSALWSAMTAYHALSLTTLLSRRWLHYYSLLPSLIRLLALQALCWPLVRLTLFVFGPRNPLPAWTLISVTTAFSDTVARWLVSNITDESELLMQGAVSTPSSARPGRSRGRGRAIGMSFWRAIVGAPPRQRSGRVSATLTTAERGGALSGLRIAHAIESEAESDCDVLSATSASRHNNFSTTASALRRRRLRSLQRDASPFVGSQGYTSEVTSGGEGDERDDQASQTGSLSHQKIERVGRIFHWDVAIRRNVVPIGALSYMTMWILLMEDIRKRWTL